VTAKDLEPHMEGMSLSDALSKKKLFMVNLKLMKDASCNTKVVPKVNSPLLFASAS
jgi:hypothetical protein